MTDENSVPVGPLLDLVGELREDAKRQEMRGNYDAEATLLSYKSELNILATEGERAFRKVRGEVDD